MAVNPHNEPCVHMVFVKMLQQKRCSGTSVVDTFASRVFRVEQIQLKLVNGGIYLRWLDPVAAKIVTLSKKQGKVLDFEFYDSLSETLHIHNFDVHTLGGVA
ncbi:hypothetical protein HS088_TW09G00730 [Tripterygium wilfordii]|uniref:Uncharacterized protein n=1 Tax=Tripterygium wilfordii TaxID=458696 RepID=A0A7J7D8V7_TRIWF|nr:hypothetical protein HS088_TW09G00730 [Tripterygium wilfordii]